jgi:hypothetical protein
VIHKAKSILACDDEFFSGENGKVRKVGSKVVKPSIHAPHELFVKNELMRKEGEVLFVRDFMQCFELFCKMRGIPPVSRRHLRSNAAAVIQKEFGVALRKDLKDDQGRWTNGWKHIAVAKERDQLGETEAPL